MSTSKLKLNPDKTEFIVFGYKRRRDMLKAHSQLPAWVVPSALLNQSKIWGVWFDPDFSLSKHVQNVYKVVLCNSTLHTGFPSILLPISLPTAVLTVPGAVRVVVISLVVPRFQPSVHKSVKQFGKSFDFYAPTLWNALPDKICASLSVASFRKLVKTYLYTKAYPP